MAAPLQRLDGILARVSSSVSCAKVITSRIARHVIRAHGHEGMDRYRGESQFPGELLVRPVVNGRPIQETAAEAADEKVAEGRGFRVAEPDDP